MVSPEAKQERFHPPEGSVTTREVAVAEDVIEGEGVCLHLFPLSRQKCLTEVIVEGVKGGEEVIVNREQRDYQNSQEKGKGELSIRCCPPQSPQVGCLSLLCLHVRGL